MKINKKKKYKSLLKQKFVWKIRNPYHGKGMIFIPQAIHEIIKDAWIEKQKEIQYVQAHTIGSL